MKAIFKVNGIEYGSYTQCQDETFEDFRDMVYRVEAEITREAYRELNTPIVTTEIIERRKR